MNLKISIITVVYNNKDFIADCIQSVLSQTHDNLEYIVIDGASIDGTVDVINRYRNDISHYVSEPDKGIYDAMNKGIAKASGDIIGILNSDDMYMNDSVLGDVASLMKSTNIDACFADLVYVDRHRTDKVVRYYSSARCTPDRFPYGLMPAHPTFFVRRACYERYGVFKTDYRIAADFELLARFLARYRISYRYIPKVLVKMRMGGLSTKSLRSTIVLNREIVRACAENGIHTSYRMIYSKYLTKISQLFRRPA